MDQPIIVSYLQALSDTIFPRTCVGCGTGDTDLCDACSKKIVLLKHQSCIRCQRITEMGRTCPTCRTVTPVYQTLSVAHYHDGPLKEALHTLKYHARRDLITHLFNLFLAHHMVADELSKLARPDVMCLAVPLHRQRQWWRGFNQSALLTDHIARHLGLKQTNNLLVRATAGKVQSSLTRAERQKNTEGVFRVRNSAQIAGKTVLLVDDIITTGATMMACAGALKQAGAKRVIALSIARG